MSNARIAIRRGISRDAVKYHVRNAIAKLGLRGRAELQRWRGVPKSSAAYRDATNKEIAMTTTHELRLGPIGQISRTVRDIDAACAWYGKVLGLKHLYTFGKLAFFDLGGTRLYLSAEGGEPGPESTLYLRVDDIGAAYAELSARGVEFTGRAAPDPSPRRRNGGVDGVLQGSRGPVPGLDVAGATERLSRVSIFSRARGAHRPRPWHWPLRSRAPAAPAARGPRARRRTPSANCCASPADVEA